MLPKLYSPKTLKKVRRVMVGIPDHYSSGEMQDRMGISPTTLLNRRNSADAKAYWKLQGVSTNVDAAYDLLNMAHKIYNKRHYFEKTLADRFIELYKKNPYVQRAKDVRDRMQVLNTAPYVLRTEEDIDKLTKAMKIILKSEDKPVLMWFGVDNA